MVGDLSAITRHIFAGADAHAAVTRGGAAVAAVAEQFHLDAVPWYLSVCPGDYGNRRPAEDAAVAHIREIWQLNVG